MISGSLRKLHIAAAVAILLTCISEMPLFAEFIFKKDGSIVKGIIIKDNPASISVKKEGGVFENVNRKDVLRIIYTDLYLGKVYARLTSGEIVEGYQVDEDRDNYFFRKELNSPEEFTIPRRKIMFIARTNPTDVKGNPSTVFIIMTWSQPFKPAKFYRVYIRDVKNKEEKFKPAGETADLTYTLKNLLKSWSYELYVTAISVSGEESLPSEKIIVNTLPERPENLTINEQISQDGKTVALTFKWDNVTDPESRVKTYTIYEVKDGENKKKGTSKGSEFVIKDFPAEGRHWFSLVAVNDLFTESDEIKAVYDAGYKIYIRGMLPYIYPVGTMRDMATSGYGVLIDAGIAWKKFSIGLETGILIFNYTQYIKSMVMLPVLLEADYRIPLFSFFTLRPVIKAGWSYDMIKYVVLNPANPLITSTCTKNNFDPMISGGACLQYDLNENVDIFGGIEYSVIFQKIDRMAFISGSFGAGIVF